ncbi:hypothetical protein B0H21DRAFT_34441 [Amylocystis lapponica]|nr:hypothetical protein B0H21DRAFT_34441 [Amylocystis lapponica]
MPRVMRWTRLCMSCASSPLTLFPVSGSPRCGALDHANTLIMAQCLSSSRVAVRLQATHDPHFCTARPSGAQRSFPILSTSSTRTNGSHGLRRGPIPHQLQSQTLQRLFTSLYLSGFQTRQLAGGAPCCIR